MLISIFKVSHRRSTAQMVVFFAVFDLQKPKRDDIKAQISFSRSAADEEVLNLHNKPALETTWLGSIRRLTVKRKVRIRGSKLSFCCCWSTTAGSRCCRYPSLPYWTDVFMVFLPFFFFGRIIAARWERRWREVEGKKKRKIKRFAAAVFSCVSGHV